MIVKVNLGEQSYEIIIKRGAIEKAGNYLNLDRKVLVVTDSGVPEKYVNAVIEHCKNAVKIVLPQGEQSKSIENFQLLLKAMLDNSFTRGDCVTAVGGGVIGDLSGFACSCYMRGIDFYNMPTTLLSQVDSSIGGKTAIDFCGFKNSVGTFYQPRCVIIDPDTLKTLDKRQFASGLTEAIKMAANFDAGLFEFIEKSEKIESDIDEIIFRSLCIKRDVVEKDPKETNLRKVLNFGHTVGHAIESKSENLLHGECVAMGMPVMSSGEARERIKAILEKYGLKTEIPYDADILIPYILHDKKMKEDFISAVICEKIGTFEIKDVTIENIRKAIEFSKK